MGRKRMGDAEFKMKLAQRVDAIAKRERDEEEEEMMVLQGTADNIPRVIDFPESLRGIYRSRKAMWEENNRYPEFKVEKGNYSDEDIREIIEDEILDSLVLIAYEMEQDEKRKKMKPKVMKPEVREGYKLEKLPELPRPNLDTATDQEVEDWLNADIARRNPVVSFELTPDNLPAESILEGDDRETYLGLYRKAKRRWGAEGRYPSLTVNKRRLEGASDEEVRQRVIMNAILDVLYPISDSQLLKKRRATIIF